MMQDYGRRIAELGVAPESIQQCLDLWKVVAPEGQEGRQPYSAQA